MLFHLNVCILAVNDKRLKFASLIEFISGSFMPQYTSNMHSFVIVL